MQTQQHSRVRSCCRILLYQSTPSTTTVKAGRLHHQPSMISMRKWRQHSQDSQGRTASCRHDDGEINRRIRRVILLACEPPLLLVVVLFGSALLASSASALRPPSMTCSEQRRQHHLHRQHPWSGASQRHVATWASTTAGLSARPYAVPTQPRPEGSVFGKSGLLAASSSSSVAWSESSGAQRDVSDPVSPRIDMEGQVRLNGNATTALGLVVEDAPQVVEESSTTTEKKLPFPVVVWKFSRPHTLIGSAIAIPALHFLAAPALPMALSARTAASILYAMLPSLLMNIYITGLNQISDVEIDRINKPYLVLPAGIMSRPAAVGTVIVCLILSLALGHVPVPWATEGLAFALWGSAILGTMYSIKPFRLKRFPLLAAFCIVAVRGTIINASFFAHATAAAYGGSGSVLNALLTNPKCLLSSLFFCVFGVVIALMKDVPDVRGDLKSRVRTFSVRLGQDRVFHWSRRLLTALFWTYGVGLVHSAIVTAATSTVPYREVAVPCVGRAVAAIAAFWAGQSVRRQSRGVDPNDSAQVYDYYMHLWKLFYGSYLALPFAR